MPTMPLTVGLTAVCDLKSTESVTFLYVHLTYRGGYIASVTSLGEPVPDGKNDEIFLYLNKQRNFSQKSNLRRPIAI